MQDDTLLFDSKIEETETHIILPGDLNDICYSFFLLTKTYLG